MVAKNTLIKIFNGQIVTPNGIIKNGAVIVRNGFIETVAEGNLEANGAVEIDAKGQYVAPGLIDIQVNGYDSVSFCLEGAENT
jgi:N-acetylglucosamine-6-phosphate deacetylase